MKPILFNDEMVRAILDGRKTQTRRVVDSIAGMGRVTEFQASHTPGYAWTFRDRRSLWNDLTGSQLLSRCPLGQPGSRLWVREAWMPDAPRNGEWSDVEFYGCAMSPLSLIPDHYRKPNHCLFRATWDGGELAGWKPSIHMPRWASRITLEITDVRVQRLQEIPTADVWAEGFSYIDDEEPGWDAFSNVECGFADAWDSIAKPGAKWDDDPWVWAISFKRVEA